jgi:hypothetical protein
MRDEIDSRLWVEHGPPFAAAIDAAIAAIAAAVRPALRRIHEVEFGAPWKQQRGHQA